MSWHSVSWASAEPFLLVPGKEEAVPGRESGCQPDMVYLHSTQPDTSQLFTALDLVLARLAGTWPHCSFVPSQPGAQQGTCSSGSPCSWVSVGCHAPHLWLDRGGAAVVIRGPSLPVARRLWLLRPSLAMPLTGVSYSR